MRTIKEKDLLVVIQDNVDGIKRQLANPLLREDLKIYWTGQWDGIFNIARTLKIKAEKRQ